MDLDFTELELFPPTEKIQSPHEVRVRQAAKYILQNYTGVISISILTKTDVDAANLLVEECLLHCTDDLFEDIDDVDPEGFIKIVPDEPDLMFIGSLLRYSIDPTSYFRAITLPEVWKNRLSANGIKILRTMKFYRNILDSTPSTELLYDNEPSNPSESDEDETIPVQRSSYNEKAAISSDNRLRQYHHAADVSHSDLGKTTNICNNSNRQGSVNSISDFDRPTLDKELSEKISHIQNDHDYVVAEPQHDTSVHINRPTMNWNLLRKRMIGLRNDDDKTCYINSAVQCLASTPPLVRWLFDQFDKLTTCK